MCRLVDLADHFRLFSFYFILAELEYFLVLFIYLTPKTFCIGGWLINNVVIVSGDQ